MALELNQTCYKNAGLCQTLHKITQPKLDSGLYFRKNISFRPSSFSLFNKGLWNKNKENRNNKERIHRFQSKVQHIWWFLCVLCTSTIMQNTLELVKQICHVFSFPLRFLTLWSMVLHQLGSACNFSGSCHVVSAKSYQVHRVMIFGKCAMPVCSRGALQQLTVLAQSREIMGTHLLFPQKFPPRFPVFFPDV